jgi:hypothetical protein
LASRIIHPSSDQSSILVSNAATILAKSDTWRRPRAPLCETKQRRSAHAIPSASSTDAHLNKTCHAVSRTSPLVVPDDNSYHGWACCSTKELSTFTFIQVTGGRSHSCQEFCSRAVLGTDVLHLALPFSSSVSCCRPATVNSESSVRNRLNR